LSLRVFFLYVGTRTASRLSWGMRLRMSLRTIQRMTSSRYCILQLTRSREKLSQSPLILVGMGLLLSFDLSLGLSKLLLDAFLSWPASRTQEVYSLAHCVSTCTYICRLKLITLVY
jgi:hypothetical protein